MSKLVRLMLVKDEEGKTSAPIYMNPSIVECVMPHPRYTDRCILFAYGSGKNYELMQTAADVAERLNSGKHVIESDL